jgi:class 3 adenylate cyclase
LLAWVIKIAADAAFQSSHRLIGRLLPTAQHAAVAAGGLPGTLGFDSDATSADSEKAREDLLKKYREIENALKSSKRKLCTFLSIDVVGSTQMKIGERETAIAATFQAYEELLRKIFDQYGAWKQAWTPDGVMICFLDRELAVGAGQRVLQSLKKFNENDNKLHTPFRVRCGLNEGEVPIYEDSKLEKIADRVIDVAGHMQKQGTPDTLWLPSEVYNGLGNKAGFQPVETVVDGYQVYVWKPASA